MADEVLLRVPLQLEKTATSSGPVKEIALNPGEGMDEDGQDDLSDIVKELSATCFEYRREETRRMICKVGRFGTIL